MKKVALILSKKKFLNKTNTTNSYGRKGLFRYAPYLKKKQLKNTHYYHEFWIKLVSF